MVFVFRSIDFKTDDMILIEPINSYRIAPSVSLTLC